MSKKFIGREEEIKVLHSRLRSKEAEFIALYGRRRVGKTYLIRHAIEKEKLNYIEIVGLKDGALNDQLEIFKRAFVRAFQPPFELATPKSWMQAFDMLTLAITQRKAKEPIVLFLDELPWLATPKSGLLQAIDHFWNTEWVKNPTVKLVVCGSAAAWILDNLVNAKGGLHNRLTLSMLLKPFTFKETAAFLMSRNIKMKEEQILDIYLAMGGIPFYLKSIEKGYSAAQNINQLCFTSTGLLFSEFDRLYSSLFKNSGSYIAIIQTIAKHPQGISQKMLETNLRGASSGGTLTKRLSELEVAGFVSSFVPYGNEKKGVVYKIIDEYTLFYLYWIAPVKNRAKHATSKGSYWQSKSQSPKWKSWVGYAFEAFCYKHIEQIAHALKIYTGFVVGTWRYVPKSKDEKGVQIDLLFDRDDGVVNLFEIKYSHSFFRITKQYASQLADKIDVFKEKLKIKKDIHLTMITLMGLLPNRYTDELVSSEVTLKDFQT